MNEVSLKSFASGMQTSPIGQRNTLPQGDNYLFMKQNNEFNVIVEYAPGKWTGAKESAKGFIYSSGDNINKPIDNGCRWIALNTGIEQTTNKKVDTSVTLDFQSVPLKSVLRMKVNEKGYSSLDLKPLTTKEVKALTAEAIEE
jgi:hypothetical protein